jgi:hypothetical protein
MEASLVMEALNRALGQRQVEPEQLLIHSDPPSARKVDASPSRSLFPPGGLMEQNNASLQRGRQS